MGHRQARRRVGEWLADLVADSIDYITADDTATEWAMPWLLLALVVLFGLAIGVPLGLGWLNR